MTQEDKELLLKDLCARLPYGVMILEDIDKTFDGGCVSKLATITEIKGEKMFLTKNSLTPVTVEEIRPYLRSLSSMTEEEKKDILQSLNIHGDIDNEGNLLLGVECDIITLKVCKKYFGELNKRMFDVCHMIEKGLALEAPDGMYK